MLLNTALISITTYFTCLRLLSLKFAKYAQRLSTLLLGRISITFLLPGLVNMHWNFYPYALPLNSSIEITSGRESQEYLMWSRILATVEDEMFARMPIFFMD